MAEKLKEFIKQKHCNGYKIGDEDIVCNSYPEDYYFIRKENSKWIYGESNRDDETIVKEFMTEDEALSYLLYILYMIDMKIKLKKQYTMSAIQLQGSEKIKFIDSIFEEIERKKLKIDIENNTLIYNENYIIENYLEDTDIEHFYYLQLFDLRVYELTKKELIEFGVDPLELDKYFKFENLIDL